MKIKLDFELEKLVDYGFEVVDKELEERNENYDVCYSDYKFNLGYARRGQYYWLLVDAGNRCLSIVATQPEGSGCSININDIFFKLIEDGVVERS